MIAIVSRNWFPSVKGGAEKFISRLAEALFREGFDVIGITRYVRGYEEPRAVHRLIYYCDDRPLPIISSLRFSFWAARIVNRLRPDVVIVNSYWGEASPIFIDKKIPVISIIHDVGLFCSEWAKKHRLKHILRVFVLKRIVKRVKFIVVPMEAVKRDIVKYLGVCPSKIFVLGLEGVDGPFKWIHEENMYFDIVQVGRFAPNKDHITTLKAFQEVVKEIPNARLWLVGGRPLDPEHKHYFARIVALAKEINSSLGVEAVRIIIDAPSVDPYYRLADVCIAPSIGEEGFGLTVVECMSYGKPVIASDVFVKTGVAASERCIIFRRGNYRELANEIKELYKNKELYRKLVNSGLAYAKKHNWSYVVEKFIEIIRKSISV